MRVLPFLFSLALSSSILVSGQTDKVNCTGADQLKCNERGYCVEGAADFSNQPLDAEGNPLPPHETDDIGGESCVCETGFTGVNCDTTIQFCDGGKHSCLNNGNCVAGTIQSTGATVHVCNCVGSHDDDGNHFIGLHCETPTPVNQGSNDAVVDATACDDTGKLYCVNGGVCMEDIDDDQSEICDCPPDFVGYHCEYHRAGAKPVDGGPGLVEEAHDDCNLNCKNGGECYVGTRNATDAELSFNASFNANVLDKFQHCRCDKGFAGIFCEKKYTTCGVNHCYHDSVCQREVDDVEAHCVCTGNATHSFVGTSCQTHSTSFCTKSPGVNGHQFCTNNGQCKDIGNGLFDCTCSSDFHGAHCEFPIDLPLPETHKKCDLQCENGGKCMEGKKTHGILGDMSDLNHLLNSTVPSAAANTREYCDCPTGFAGHTCEHEVKVCGNDQHVCFHGSECVADGQDFKCNCGTSKQESGVDTAGIYCQHKSTTVCDAASKKFCVNDGVCQDDNSCKCPDTYRGPFCEFKVTQAASSVSSTDDDALVKATLPEDYKDERANKRIITSSGIVGGIAILLIIGVVIITGTSAEQAPQSDMVNVPPVTMFPPSPGPPPVNSEISSSDLQSATDSQAASGDVAQDGSTRNLDFNDATEGEAAVHVNELI